MASSFGLQLFRNRLLRLVGKPQDVKIVSLRRAWSIFCDNKKVESAVISIKWAKILVLKYVLLKKKGFYLHGEMFRYWSDILGKSDCIKICILSETKKDQMHLPYSYHHWCFSLVIFIKSYIWIRSLLKIRMCFLCY